jgi:nucleoid-associated protein YgaU
MAITSLRALLFTAGGVVAVAGAAYVSGAFQPDANIPVPAEVAASTPPAATETAPAVTASGTEGRLAATPVPAGDATAPATPDADAKPAAVIAPTFDVVRVEHDGSVVIAGKAAPNATVEIVNGSVVLGQTVAGPEGTFAIVLDDPLKPGNYQIVLRSTAPDKVVAASEQTAVISVPEKAGGQVLAMVEEPGKPAALLTVPEPEKKPEAPAATGQTATEAPGAEAPAEEVAAAPAATTPAPATETTPVKPAIGPTVVVEAVEIDGSKIFVAGLTDAGRKVRAYANDIVLGEAFASPDGHFLVEATRDIPVGQYTIRVDALESDGVKVVARAAVPFEREPGESIAAVAPDATKPAETAPAGEAAKAETPAAPAASAAAPAAAVPERVAPKLQHADGAVIIRRGDSLWRISRRVYGHGIRYSTIYLANQEQISDPDRIWPGQVFKVPEKSKEGEAADLKALGDQMTTTPTQQ